MEATDDPVRELAAAQRQLRRRAALTAAGALAIAVVALVAVARTRRAPADPPPLARPYLWRVEGARPSYLFGTLHIAYGVDDLPAAVRAAFAGATTVVLESDLLASAGGAGASLGAAAEGRGRLTDAEWAQLAALTGAPEAALVGQPSSQLLGAALASQARRVEPMDRGFQARAMAARRAVVFLERRELTEVAAADAAPLVDEPAVLAALRQALAAPSAVRGALRRIVRAYAAGSDAGCAAGALAGLVETLNAGWIAGIAAALDRGDAFVAIGCAHLVGADGVIAQLRARGYTVTRVAR